MLEFPSLNIACLYKEKLNSKTNHDNYNHITIEKTYNSSDKLPAPHSANWNENLTLTFSLPRPLASFLLVTQNQTNSKKKEKKT